MWPLELTAMPLTSPRYMLSGSLSGSGTESKLMTGGVCCCAKTVLNGTIRAAKASAKGQEPSEQPD